MNEIRIDEKVKVPLFVTFFNRYFEIATVNPD